MPPTTSFSILLLLLSFTLRPLSSTLHHRRVLHQPLLPEDTTPPSPPPAPSPPKYPFTSSTPDNSPFFPSYTSPPAPPSPASFATFPANISSISVPRSSKPNSSSSKLIAAAVAAVIAAIAVVSLAVFLHLRKRSADRAAASSLDESKTQRSDSCSTISFNQTPNIHHIPKLQRPSQTSSEFLYLGTLVNSHAPGGGGSAAFGGSSTGTINYNNASNARKFDSPELRPLPPLNMQLGFRQNSRNTADVVASKDDESEEFYSPKGSINGKGGSIGTGSASRRAFAAIEVENFNGSTSNSSSTYSSSVPGSGSASPVRSRSSSLSLENNLSRVNSMPKSPDLIELPPQTLSPPETRALFLHDSITPSPPSSSSPERYSRRSEESSPRISNISDQNVESHASQTQHNTTVIIPTPPDIQGVVLPKSGSPLPLSSSYPQRYLRGSEESSRRNSNVSDQNGISSPAQHNLTAIPTAPENKALVTPESASSSPERCLMRSVESSPKNSNASDQNVDSPVRISSPAHHNLSDSSSPKIYSGKNEELSRRVFSASDQSSPVQHNTIVNPTPLEMEDLVLSSPERCSRRSEDSSPRDSNVADQEMESPVSNPVQHNTIVNPTPLEMEDLVLSSPERRSGRSEDSSVRDSNVADQEVESPVSNPVQHNTIVNPTPLEMEDLVPLFLEKYNSDASDHDVASPVRISSSEQHKPPSPMSSSLPERLDESDQNVEAPPPLPLMYLPDFEPSVSSPAPPASAILPQPLSIPPPPPPPPPLPLPLSKAWQSPKTPTPPAKGLMEPPTLKNPLKPIAFDSTTLISPIQLPSSNDALIDNSDSNKESPNKETEYSSENVDSNGESPPKPKLKPLHWDKVRASSDREMVWDQLKCSSFELNEEMIETLFVVNTPKPNPNVAARWQVLPPPGQDNDNWVLDPKKAQNIAILLKALHVTADEVCEGLLEGNADNLGTELLEGLLKMAPTKEEEHKLKEYKDYSPVNLGPAERFLKAVVEVPHAFRRIESMLYISNFESEVEYLKQSFSTLEAACEELRTSKMFLKLLEAVLKTGNRMNVGTNRGDAHAFKLDTLLKLVDVKGADGKTTLLHFVVQEIIRSEGARLSGGGSQENSITDDIKCRKLGLQVVSALSSELSNVKKAAVMDAEILSSEVSKLSKGIENVREIVKIIKAASLEESCIHTFSNSMNSFVEKAEEEIFKIQAQENLALSLVKEITEYFHGNSAKEEAHPFRIFMVVRDFLTTLDRVCKDVGMINERTIVSSAHKFPVPVNPMLQQVSGVSHSRQNNLSDDESFPLNA